MLSALKFRHFQGTSQNAEMKRQLSPAATSSISPETAEQEKVKVSPLKKKQKATPKARWNLDECILKRLEEPPLNEEDDGFQEKIEVGWNISAKSFGRFLDSRKSGKCPPR